MRFYTLTDMQKAGRTTDRAVRWWEEQGLLGAVERGPRGHRRYTAQQLERARFIGAAQAAGWSLEETKTDMLRWDKLRTALEHRLAVTQRWLKELPEPLEYDL